MAKTKSDAENNEEPDQFAELQATVNEERGAGRKTVLRVATIVGILAMLVVLGIVGFSMSTRRISNQSPPAPALEKTPLQPKISIKKVAGDGQLIANGDFGLFVVEVLADNQPATGRRVMWNSPGLGRSAFVGITDSEGKSSSPLLYPSTSKASVFKQVATVLSTEGPIPQWLEIALADPGPRVEFEYLRPPSAPAPTSSGLTEPPARILPKPVKAVAEANYLRSLTIIQVSGQGQVIPPSQWKSFTAKVVDTSGRPVQGVYVVWTTPKLGQKSYVASTDSRGLTSATQLFTSAVPGRFVQRAAVVTDPSATSIWPSEAPPTGSTVEFAYAQASGGDGCSDGNRDGFADAATYPRIAGCLGAWHEDSTRASKTGNACGNDLSQSCAAPADLCASHWHICGIPPYGPADLADKLTLAQCVGEKRGMFIAALGDQACEPCAAGGYDAVCCGASCLDAGGSCVWPNATRYLGVLDGHNNLCNDVINDKYPNAIGVLCCED